MFLETPTYTTDMQMSEWYSIPMALVDLIPVILFFLAGAILIKDLYNKLVKGNYALLTTGILMVFMAGTLKALWKILVASQACDFVALNTIFFPMQALGFMCYGLALVGILYSKKLLEKGTVRVKASILVSIGSLVLVAVEPFRNNMPFVVLQIVGDCIALGMLIYMAAKMKHMQKSTKIITIMLIAISTITMFGMGYLSTKSDHENPVALINWIAEIVNTISQATLFAGVFLMHKNGLEGLDAFDVKIPNEEAITINNSVDVPTEKEKMEQTEEEI